MTRGTLTAAALMIVLWMSAGAERAIAAAPPADDTAARVAEAQRKLAERQAAAKKVTAAAVAAKPASRPATAPAADGPKRSDRVVFLLDLSGTAASNGRSWESRAAIGRAVASLGGKQAYAILIACHGGAVYPKNATMLGATPPNLELSADFLRDFTGGGADGLAVGFDRAAALQPDVVWVLTDGDFTEGVPIAEAAKRLRATGARINSSLIGASDLATAKQLALIYGMAADNGGICVDDEGRRLDFLPAKSRDPSPAGNEHPADLPDLAKGPNVLKE